MSNLFKSGFVAFSKEDALVIDTNRNRIIESIDASLPYETAAAEESEEDVLAAALIRDVGLDEESGDAMASLVPDFSEVSDGFSEEEIQEKSEELLVSAKKDAEEIINQAHEEAERLRAAAYDEAEQIKQQSREEGYQAGYCEGEKQALEEYEEKKAQYDARLAENEQYLDEKEAALVTETEHKMVDLLCQFIPKITGISIEGERDVLLYIINMAMHDLDNSTKFVIRVSSKDYAMLSERRNEIYGALNPGIELEIFEDAKLSPMQCLIDTDNGMVDVSLDVQLNNLIKALKLMS